MPAIRIKRGTRAQLESAKTAGTLAAGEPYLITDEGRLAVGTATNAYTAAATQSHASAHASGQADALSPAAIGAEPALGNPAASGYVLSSTASGTRSWIASPSGGDSLNPFLLMGA